MESLGGGGCRRAGPSSGAASRRTWELSWPFVYSVGPFICSIVRSPLMYPEDVRSALTALSWQRIIAALGLTGASYILLILYDLLALRHMRKTLPLHRVALASFTSYAFTHRFGFGSLMHATI